MSTHQGIYICRTCTLNWQIYEFEASYLFVIMYRFALLFAVWHPPVRVVCASHWTVPDELWIIYKAKLQYVMFENHFSSRKLGREESGWIFSKKKVVYR